MCRGCTDRFNGISGSGTFTSSTGQVYELCTSNYCNTGAAPGSGGSGTTAGGSGTTAASGGGSGTTVASSGVTCVCYNFATVISTSPCVCNCLPPYSGNDCSVVNCNPATQDPACASIDCTDPLNAALCPLRCGHASCGGTTAPVVTTTVPVVTTTDPGQTTTIPGQTTTASGVCPTCQNMGVLASTNPCQCTCLSPYSGADCSIGKRNKSIFISLFFLNKDSNKNS